jgi:CRP-like cAMP-binding protein
MADPPEVITALYLGKLERRAPLSVAGREAILALPARRKAYSTYQDIVSEGSRPTRCCLVESGLVSRYKTLRNGSRQILSFHIPGDMIDLSAALVVVADHGIRTHSPTIIITVDQRDVLQVAADFPEVGRAFWFDTLVDAAIFREWTVNVGRRNARERTAHLLLEFAYRFKAANMTSGDSFELPVSQADLADALGITSVHLNRTLQWLRRERYIRTHSKTISIENWEEMVQLAGFTSAYLHPEGPRPLPARDDR